MNNNKNFFQNVVSEMKKVSWPTGQEVVRYTTTVVVTVIFFLAFFYVLDIGITALVYLMYFERRVIMSLDKVWYVVHTYTGYENKVKANLEARLESMNMQDLIFRVVIPEEEETTIRDGKKKTAMKKTFPGYVLVELIMTDESWYVVRNTPGVTGFVGSQGAGSKPNPLLPEEVKFILRQMGMSEKIVDVEVAVGESINIIAGPFNNQSGVIESIDEERYKLTVLVENFGRETPVEVEFDQIEKL